eukprot:m.481245 g.481245  ORF g.481245 m.481245 type:complete len:1000 (-) comp21715_c0_seq8:54-3053(-)
MARSCNRMHWGSQWAVHCSYLCTVVAVAMVHFVHAAPPHCDNLSGIWDTGNIVQQDGDQLTIFFNGEVVAIGTISGKKITMFVNSTGVPDMATDPGKPSSDYTGWAECGVRGCVTTGHVKPTGKGTTAYWIEKGRYTGVVDAQLAEDCSSMTYGPPLWPHIWHNPCPDPTFAKHPCGRTPSHICCKASEACIGHDYTGKTSCVPADDPQAGGSDVERVYIIFMQHLDLGFTDTCENVCDTYFQSYFPRAFNVSKVLRERGGVEQFRWTQFPWMIQEYLDGAAGCGKSKRTAQDIADMEEAIAHDGIVWQANALNMYVELLDDELWDYSIKMRDRLNKRFNKTHGTLAGHMAEYGMTRAAVRGLADNGVKAFHVGYNGVGGMPEVPPVFYWLDNETGQKVLTFVEDHHGDHVYYDPKAANADVDALRDTPGIPSASPQPQRWRNTLQGMHHKRLNRTITVPGHPEVALYFDFHSEYGGVPAVDEVLDVYAQLRTQFPKAALVAGTIDDFVRDVLSSGDLSKVPVITAEMGDAWLYGVPADPTKLAVFREARRQLKRGVAEGKIDVHSKEYDSYMRRLMKGPPEHNWGLSVSKWLPELWCPNPDCPSTTTWANNDFHASKTHPGYTYLEAEWAAQRAWCYPREMAESGDNATIGHGAWAEFVATLQTALRDVTEAPGRVARAVEGLSRERLASRGGVEEEDDDDVVDGVWPSRAQCGHLEVSVNGTDGSIAHLVDTRSGRQWAGPANPLARFVYRTFDGNDYETFHLEYDTDPNFDFMKSGMDSAHPESRTWEARATRTHTEGACSFVSELVMADPDPHSKYGAPAHMVLNITIDVPINTDVAASAPVIRIEFTWRNKTATRLAEAMLMSFVPRVGATDPPTHWMLDVLGVPVNPAKVLPGGTRFKHAVWDGIALVEDGNVTPLRIAFKDTAVVAVGDTAHLLRFCHAHDNTGARDDCTYTDPVATGMHAMLAGNLWGTCFPQWNGDDGVARFQLTLAYAS